MRVNGTTTGSDNIVIGEDAGYNISSGGKNIAPAPLENALLTSTFIDQVLVIGDKRNFLSCLIVPSFDNVTPVPA